MHPLVKYLTHKVSPFLTCYCERHRFPKAIKFHARNVLMVEQTYVAKIMVNFPAPFHIGRVDKSQDIEFNAVVLQTPYSSQNICVGTTPPRSYPVAIVDVLRAIEAYADKKIISCH